MVRRHLILRPLLLLASLLVACDRPLQRADVETVNTPAAVIGGVPVVEIIAETPVGDIRAVGDVEVVTPLGEVEATPTVIFEVVAPPADETVTRIVISSSGEDSFTPTSTPESTITASDGDQPLTHVVSRGETLYEIGRQYGVSWMILAESNNVTNPHRLTIGQVLEIPTAEEKATSTPSVGAETQYVVRPGDTLYLIARRYRVTWQAIADANQLPPPYVIYPGQSLVIPGG